MSELLRVNTGRLEVLRVINSDAVIANGIVSTTRVQTKVEFLVLDCDDCKADGERDPTQSVDQFIEYYFDGSSVLYKYSHKLPLLKQVDRNAGIRVIATCGQDPCSPVMD